MQAGYDPKANAYPCTSSMSIGGQTFKNFEGESAGDISLGKALEISCDTVFYGLAYDQWLKDGGLHPKHPKDWFYKTAHEFHLGQKSGVDLPGEVSGRVPDRQWKIDYYNVMKNIWCAQAKSNKQDYATKIAREDCTDGMVMRAGDSANYAIGQGDTLVTPIQEAVIYSALANGGTLYQPEIGKAIISADGKSVQEIKPKAVGKLPDTSSTIAYIDQALQGVITEGTAAWKFGGWPQNKIPLQAKTGTAEVYGKQTTGWLATYSKDYAVIMTIAQAGTGSGATGQAVRNIYSALYGVQPDGSIDAKKAILPHPPQNLPKIGPDGVVQQASFTHPSHFVNPTTPEPAVGSGVILAALPPDRNEKLLLGRRYQA